MNGSRKIGDACSSQEHKHLAGLLKLQATPEAVRSQVYAIAPIRIAVVGRGRFSATIDGRVIVPSSRQPFLDAARVLLAEGGPATILEMWREGVASFALRVPLGVAAKAKRLQWLVVPLIPAAERASWPTWICRTPSHCGSPDSGPECGEVRP